MNSINDELLAAMLLFAAKCSYTRKTVFNTKHERVFTYVPQKRRSSRVPVSSCSSLTIIVKSWTRETLEDDIHNGPLIESLKNKRKHHHRVPQSKNAKRRIDCRFEGEASSSRTREMTPEWLVRLMRSKNGVEPKKIIQKRLTATDLASVQGRLSMPFSQITDFDFLSPTEERIIHEHLTKIRKKGVDAILVNSDLREYDVNLRRWDMKKASGSITNLYNLVTGWNQVVRDCCLKETDEICLWSFHANDQLYFALVPPSSSESKF